VHDHDVLCRRSCQVFRCSSAAAADSVALKELSTTGSMDPKCTCQQLSECDMIWLAKDKRGLAKITWVRIKECRLYLALAVCVSFGIPFTMSMCFIRAEFRIGFVLPVSRLPFCALQPSPGIHSWVHSSFGTVDPVLRKVRLEFPSVDFFRFLTPSSLLAASSSYHWAIKFEGTSL
jgi:hypothetical protein